jgi:hypothetical protein
MAGTAHHHGGHGASLRVRACPRWRDGCARGRSRCACDILCRATIEGAPCTHTNTHTRTHTASRQGNIPGRMLPWVLPLLRAYWRAVHAMPQARRPNAPGHVLCRGWWRRCLGRAGGAPGSTTARCARSASRERRRRRRRRRRLPILVICPTAPARIDRGRYSALLAGSFSSG